MSLKRQKLAPTKGSLVDLVCNVTSQPYLIIHWWHNNIDVTSLSRLSRHPHGIVNGLSSSILRFNLDDIGSKYNCVWQKQSSRSVECTAAFKCTAFYFGFKSETLVTRSTLVSATLGKYKFLSVSHIETSDLLLNTPSWSVIHYITDYHISDKGTLTYYILSYT